MLDIISGIAMFVSLASYQGGPIQRQDIQCMARAIYHEARGEPIMGQVAVGWVIKNRVGHRWFANTVCGVVYQKNAFSGITRNNPMLDKKAYEAAIVEAIMVYVGYVDDPTNGSILYHNPKLSPHPRWDFTKIKHTFNIFNHRFYKQGIDG